MKKKPIIFVIAGILVIVVIAALAWVNKIITTPSADEVMYSDHLLSADSQRSQILVDKYPMLNSDLNDEIGYTNIENLWFGEIKQIGTVEKSLSSRSQDFYCKSLKVEPVVYSGKLFDGVVDKNDAGLWKGKYSLALRYTSPRQAIYTGFAVAVVDCGSYYWIYKYGSTGPSIHGPFDVAK